MPFITLCMTAGTGVAANIHNDLFEALVEDEVMNVLGARFL